MGQQIEKYDGRKIRIPDGMSLDTALMAIEAEKMDQLTVVGVAEQLKLFPLDGAYVLQRCIREMYGMRRDLASASFFGVRPPTTVSVEVALGQYENVMWGEFALAGIEGKLSCGTTVYDGMPIFQLEGQVLRRDMPKVNELMSFARSKAQEYSLYRAKALVFEPSENGDGKMSLFNKPPRFFALNGMTKADIILPEDTYIALDAGLFTLIESPAECRAAGISTKRAVILEGPPGTGKTLAGTVAASLCTMHGRTFQWVQDAKFLHEGLKFALVYGPTLIYVEDIERVMSERDDMANTLLNAVDGMESKNLDVILVFTTNYANRIIDTFKRGGRGDWIISLPFPDTDAACRLLKKFAPAAKMNAAEWLEIASMLADSRIIPANIREVCDRAKLVGIRNRSKGIGYEDLRVAARWVANEKGVPKDDLMPKQKGIAENTAEAVESIKERIEVIAKRKGVML